MAREFIMAVDDDHAYETAKTCEEIVRCRDCIYYSVVEELFMHGSNEPVQLIMGCFKSRRDERVKRTDFCCWGRRRDG